MGPQGFRGFRGFRGFLAALAVCAAAGAVAAQVSVALSQPPDAGRALWAGVRVALGAWIAWAALGAIVSVTWGRADDVTRGRADDATRGRAGGAPAGTPPAVRDWQIAVAGGALLVAGTLDAPARLVVTLLGYAGVALPLLWIVRRRGGAGASALAAGALAVFAALPLVVDRREVPAIEHARPGSPYRWTVGWRAPDWAIRHEVALPAGVSPPRWLDVMLPQRYGGPARVLATVNGEEAGALDAAGSDGRVMTLRLPERAGGQGGQGGRLTVELRQRPHDPALRLLAQRWTAGATLGTSASSFFDGRRWLPGTFAADSGRHQDGVLVVQLRAEP